MWNGAALTTTVVSNTQLTAQIPATQIANPGTVSIPRRDKARHHDIGHNVDLMVTGSGTGGGNGSFSLLSLNPYTVAMGSADFTLTATGVGFANGDAITWNGTALTTTFDSATQVHATVPAASNVTTAATIQIAVKDASNNSTNALPFIVTGGTAGTPPTLTSLNPEHLV